MFACGPADATAIPKPHHLLPLSFKYRLVLVFPPLFMTKFFDTSATYKSLTYLLRPTFNRIVSTNTITPKLTDRLQVKFSTT